MSTDLIDTVVSNAVRTPEQVGALIERLLEVPQPKANVRHIFGPNVYMRELTVAAGVLLVGRKHRHEHDCLLVRGRLVVFNEDGTRTELTAPLEFSAGAGRKIARIEEDMTFVNVFPFPNGYSTDVEALELLMFEDTLPPDTRPMKPADWDFEAVLAAEGASLEAVRRASERQDDCGPFPYGAYKVKVGRSLIEGRGLIATADIDAGEYICPGTWNNWRTPAGRYTNHAKEPNAAFHYDSRGVAWLVALKQIAGSFGAHDGDEVTIDYRHTPRARWEQLS
jgi:hypothetical protein